MKIFKTLFQEDKKEFFDRYATLVATLFWMGVLAQIISAVTELGIIYNIINSNLLEFPLSLAANTITAFSWTGAILGAAFFEMGLRKLIPYCICSFIYGRWKGIDLVMSVFILVGAVTLCIGSILLSFQGSKEVVSMVSQPKEEHTHKVDLDYANSVGLLRADYRADSAAIAETYGAQLAATEIKYTGLIQAQRSHISLFERKEERTGKSYKSRKQAHLGNIAKLESKQAIEASTLQAAKRNELTNISSIKRNAMNAAESKHNNQVIGIGTRNSTAATKATEKATFYGGGLAWFTVLCMGMFILSVILDEVHKKGSGIEEQVVVSQYDFLPSATSRFWNLIKERVQEKVHSKITKWEKKIKPPQLPVVEHQLFDLGRIEQKRISVNGKEGIVSSEKEIKTVKKEDVFRTDIEPNFDFKNSSLNLAVVDDNQSFTATVNHSPSNSTTTARIAHREDDLYGQDFTAAADIAKANANNDRNKNKHKIKQRKRIIRFCKRYKEKNGKYPTYEQISDKLGIAYTSVGKYMREIKKTKEL